MEVWIERLGSSTVLGSLLVLGSSLEVHGNPRNPFGLCRPWKLMCFGHGRRIMFLSRIVFEGGFQKTCKLQLKINVRNIRKKENQLIDPELYSLDKYENIYKGVAFLVGKC